MRDEALQNAQHFVQQNISVLFFAFRNCLGGKYINAFRNSILPYREMQIFHLHASGTYLMKRN